MGLIPGSGRFPGVDNGNPFQYSCVENSMDRGAGQAAALRGHKELDMTERTYWAQFLGGEDALEEEMETHSSLKNPMTEKPGGLQSIGSQRVRPNWSDLACAHQPDLFLAYICNTWTITVYLEHYTPDGLVPEF